MSNPLFQELASLKISREVEPQPRNFARLGLSLVLGGALVTGGVVAALRLRGDIFKTEVVTTEISLISPAQASVVVTSTGFVVPQVSSSLGAKIPGRLARVMVKEGALVKTGQVVAELEDADLASSIASAEARVAAARARADASNANLAEVKQQIDRDSILVDQGALGRAPLEDLVARLHALTAATKAASAEIGVTQAEAKNLRVLLRDRIILAPIDGTVITKPPQAGDMVGPQEPLVEIADLRSLVVESDVPEARLSQIKVGAPCEIVLDAYPLKRYRGAALEIGKRVNRAKATVAVKVRFIDSVDDVLPEMAARVSFLAQALSDEAMKEPSKRAVPASAVVDRSGSKVVFVLDQGQARMVPVTLGPPLGNGFELANGPPPGTKVIDSPPATLGDGHKVKEKDL
jgi:RND family efflux transporter MFP subunit